MVLGGGGGGFFLCFCPNQFLFTFQYDFNPPLLDAWIAIDQSVNAG